MTTLQNSFDNIFTERQVSKRSLLFVLQTPLHFLCHLPLLIQLRSFSNFLRILHLKLAPKEAKNNKSLNLLQDAGLINLSRIFSRTKIVRGKV